MASIVDYWKACFNLRYPKISKASDIYRVSTIFGNYIVYSRPDNKIRTYFLVVQGNPL